MNSITQYLSKAQAIIGDIPDEPIERVISLLYAAWKQRKMVFVLGNGGNASTASHIVNDFAKATIVPDKSRMKVIALTDCVPLVTAWANDISYEYIFKEQLENLLDPGDVVIGISTSGNSANVLRAMEFARQKSAIAIGWTGLSGGKLRGIADCCIYPPTDDVGLIECTHLLLSHLISKELRMRILTEA